MSFAALDRYLNERSRPDPLAAPDGQPQPTARRPRPVQARKAKLVEAVLETLTGNPHKGLFSPEAAPARYYERVKADRHVFVTDEQLDRLLLRLNDGDEPANKQKILLALGPEVRSRTVAPGGSSDLGEIELLEVAPDGNLINDGHAPVNRYVAVYVDTVQFRQRDRSTGKVAVLPGRYVRIEVPDAAPGAVVLPVDAVTGDVLLVTQYRHPQRAWLTEVPRGFGRRNRDLTARETGLREVREETAARPIVLNRKERVVPLRTLFTDTGKLADAPGYFLFFVDRARQLREFRRYQPLMEDPCWVRLDRFLEAVFGERPVQLGLGEFAFAQGNEDRRRLFARTELDDGLLRIRDGFTTNVALLALPHLMRHFEGSERVPAEWFDLRRYATAPDSGTDPGGRPNQSRPGE